MIARQRKKRLKVKKLSTRKHKCNKRKEQWHARKDASRNWHDDVVAGKHHKERTDESEMMWEAQTIGNHSCTSLLRTESRNERSG